MQQTFNLEIKNLLRFLFLWFPKDRAPKSYSFAVKYIPEAKAFFAFACATFLYDISMRIF